MDIICTLFLINTEIFFYLVSMKKYIFWNYILRFQIVRHAKNFTTNIYFNLSKYVLKIIIILFGRAILKKNNFLIFSHHQINN